MKDREERNAKSKSKDKTGIIAAYLPAEQRKIGFVLLLSIIIHTTWNFMLLFPEMQEVKMNKIMMDMMALLYIHPKIFVRL